MKYLLIVILLFSWIVQLNPANLETKEILRSETKETTKKYTGTKRIKTKHINSSNVSAKKISLNRKKEKIKFDGEDIERRIRRVLSDEGLDDFTIELLVAQSKHESGDYKNSLTEYNNVFARHYFRADTFAISAGAPGEGHTRFAKYPSVEYATLSQLWYFKRKRYSFNWKSTYQFAAECKRKGYYEAPLSVYVSALNKYMK